MTTFHYEPAPDLAEPFVQRLRRFPREPDMLTYGLRLAAAVTIRSWMGLYHRLRITGREHLPKDGSFVLVCNHASHLDAVCLLSAVPLPKLHRAFPAAAADYFFVSVPRVWLAAIVVNALPFHRKVHIRQSMQLCRELLANPEGNILIVFPEGTRSPTGELGPFKPGIGELLAGTRIPVVPCYLTGAYRAWPKGAWIPRPGGLHLSIGTPRSFEQLPAGRHSARQIAEDLHAAVAALRTQSI